MEKAAEKALLHLEAALVVGDCLLVVGSCRRIRGIPHGGCHEVDQPPVVGGQVGPVAAHQVEHDAGEVLFLAGRVVEQASVGDAPAGGEEVVHELGDQEPQVQLRQATVVEVGGRFGGDRQRDQRVVLDHYRTCVAGALAGNRLPHT